MAINEWWDQIGVFSAFPDGGLDRSFLFSPDNRLFFLFVSWSSLVSFLLVGSYATLLSSISCGSFRY